MSNLYAPIEIAFTPEYEDYYENVWAEKNERHKLTAPPWMIKIGAFLEYIYIQRGAIEDSVKYRDVLISEAIAGAHCGVVDCKTHQIKKSRGALQKYIYDSDETRWSFYKDKGIEKVHHWTYNEGQTLLTPWYVFDVATGTRSSL